MNLNHWEDDARKPSSALLWWLILAFAAFVAWASFFEINHAVRTTGQVISSARTQVIQVADGGVISGLHVQEGQSVKQGDAVLVIESMKLEHILCAPRDAVVHSLSASVGQQVGPGQVLVQWKDAT